MPRLFLLLASLLLLTNSQPPIDNSPNINFIDLPLNLSSLNSTTASQLNACFDLVNDTTFLDGEANLAAAFARVYDDGGREYYLYIDTIDAAGSIHEYESVVAVEDGDEVYRLVSNREIPIDLPVNATAGVAPTIKTAAPAASNTTKNDSKVYTSLSGFIGSLAQEGSTLLTNDRIAADPALSQIQKKLLKDYPYISSASLTSCYTKPLGLSQTYLLFYSAPQKSTFKLWGFYVITSTLKKQIFIISSDTIAVPPSVQTN